MKNEKGADGGTQEHDGRRLQAAAGVRVLPAGQSRVGGESRQRQCQHRRRQIGHREPARRGVLHAHCEGEQRDERVLRERSLEIEAGHRYGECSTDQRDLQISCQCQKPAAMLASAGGDPTADEGACHERGDRQQRCGNRKVARVGDGKAEEHDIAGHVRHENVPQFEIADGVDQSGDAGQDKQQRRQRTIRTCRAHSGTIAPPGFRGVSRGLQL